MRPVTRFINDLLARDPDLVKIHIAHTWKIMMITGHDFVHVTTAQLLWFAQIWDLVAQLDSW